mgnify:CR=1 FL=1
MHLLCGIHNLTRSTHTTTNKNQYSCTPMRNPRWRSCWTLSRRIAKMGVPLRKTGKFGFLPGLRQARQKSKKFFKVVYIGLFSFHTRSLDGCLGCAGFRVDPCQVRLCCSTKSGIQGLMSLSVPPRLSLKFSCRSR